MRRLRQAVGAALLALCLAGCAPAAPEPAATAQTQPVQTQPPAATQSSPMQAPEPADEDFVRVQDHIEDIAVELRYATSDNFTGQPVYGFHELWLRYGTVKKLMQAQEALAGYGFSLKVWDGFRPTSAQFALWEICPDPTYVANPNLGFSAHSRGNTVDLTLIYPDGTEAVMPTGFDDFSALADRDYSDCGQEAAGNAILLEQVMTQAGFTPYFGEWWHFSDAQSYPVEESFQPVETAWYYADCQEFIRLRTQPDTAAGVLTTIPAGGQFQVLAYDGDFALAEYQGLLGYVLTDYIMPAG